MAKRRIDTTTVYSVEKYEKLPPTREIEDPEAEPVAKRNPPLKPVIREPYLPDDELVEVVNLAVALGRPLLLQGNRAAARPN